jgi:hypothetical protein
MLVPTSGKYCILYVLRLGRVMWRILKFEYCESIVDDSYIEKGFLFPGVFPHW